MTITYPLSLPPELPVKLSFAPKLAVSESESPFTFQGEFFEHQGQQLTAAVRLPPMRRAQAEEWVSWGLSLNGVVGTFLMGDPSGATARGALGGTPLVDGAGQARSKTLDTKGWTATTTVLKAGDYIQLGTGLDARLYKNLTDATTDGSGLVSLDVFPRIRGPLSDSQEITTSDTLGIWRLSRAMSWDVEAVMFGLSFNAREAL